MKVAVFGNHVNPEFIPVLEEFFSFFRSAKIEINLYKPFYNFLIEELNYSPYYTTIYHSYSDFDTDNELIFSIGGDGTFLQSVQTIRNFDVPVVGVNSGRLGFLADISKEEIIYALKEIVSGKCSIIERSLLQVDFGEKTTLDFNLALNEMTVLKSDNSSMLKINVLINGELLNNYWADGLIIATPTGSTAYSLSVGGPILTPGSKNFVITPIAPHNLTIRPIVVPDHNEIKLEVSGRGTHFLSSLDSRSVNMAFSNSIKVVKSEFTLKTILPNGHSFFNTLRNKLMWGIDKRN
ncbi:MAG: NAD kinase [Prolixibacteraceae bacterium]|nr:NAD kinase [Prolixibacteraceae bacterium]MBN2773557.1 NAD kinase [Prolixibacteraceae bacterium]